MLVLLLYLFEYSELSWLSGLILDSQLQGLGFESACRGQPGHEAGHCLVSRKGRKTVSSIFAYLPS